MVAKKNPLNEIQFGRLVESIEWSERQLEYPRSQRINAIKQFVGYNYSTNGSQKRVPTPLLKLAVNIHLRLLAPQAPRCMISTLYPDLKPTAANIELAVNQIPGEIKLQDTFRRLVLEALFSMGIAKVGLSTVGEVLGHEYGASFVDVVTLDSYVVDMAAEHYSQRQYEGNDYWLNYENVMESKWFPKKNLKDLSADEYSLVGPNGESRAKGVEVDGSAKLFKKKIWLRDVWLPAEKLMITYGVKAKKLLKVIEWKGPECGPYPILRFDDVPGNLLPLPPVAGWRDLDELANRLFRKLGDQADAQKTVQGFTGGNDESVKNFAGAMDGSGITYSGAEPKILKAGGIDPSTLMFYMQCKDLNSYFASNLDSSGGLSPQADTLGQDKLISEASGAQIRDMADKVIDFSRDIFEALAYYEWNDPIRRRMLEKKIPGTDLTIIVPWNRKTKHGKFSMYKPDIDVYSLQDNSPGMKLQKLGMILERFVLPFMPAIQEAGGTLGIQELMAMVGKYADFPEIKELVQFMQELNSGDKKESAGMPPNTTRTYERITRPGATESGKSQILQQALAGGTPQGSEMAALGRPTG